MVVYRSKAALLLRTSNYSVCDLLVGILLLRGRCCYAVEQRMMVSCIAGMLGLA